MHAAHRDNSLRSPVSYRIDRLQEDCRLPVLLQLLESLPTCTQVVDAHAIRLCFRNRLSDLLLLLSGRRPHGDLGNRTLRVTSGDCWLWHDGRRRSGNIRLRAARYEFELGRNREGSERALGRTARFDSARWLRWQLDGRYGWGYFRHRRWGEVNGDLWRSLFCTTDEEVGKLE